MHQVEFIGGPRDGAIKNVSRLLDILPVKVPFRDLVDFPGAKTLPREGYEIAQYQRFGCDKYRFIGYERSEN